MRLPKRGASRRGCVPAERCRMCESGEMARDKSTHEKVCAVFESVSQT